jgi:hypothetical protein
VVAPAVHQAAAEALQALLAFLVLYRRLAVVVEVVHQPQTVAVCPVVPAVAVAHEPVRVLAALVLVVKVLTAATPLRERRVTGRAAVVAEPHKRVKMVCQAQEEATAETV